MNLVKPPPEGGLGGIAPSLEIPNSVTGSVMFLLVFLHFTTYLKVKG